MKLYEINLLILYVNSIIIHVNGINKILIIMTPVSDKLDKLETSG